MNNLEKKSLDYAINVHKNTPNVDANIIYATSLDFKAGVEFAQRWIDVKDELPNNDERVLTKFENGKVIVNSYDTTFNKWQYEFNQNYTHWRPIEMS